MKHSVPLMTDAQITERIVSLVAWARDHYGIPEGMDATAACRRVGLELERSSLHDRTAGLLDEKNNRVLVSTDVTLKTRFDFTVFHEIMHFLLYEHGELYDYLHDVHHSDSKQFRATLERWCDEGAAEFLLPRARVRAAIAEQGFSVERVEELAAANGASIQTTAIQLAVCAPVDCYVVLCTYGATPKWPHTPALYIEQATKRDWWEFPLARGTVIPPDHLLYHVWKSKQSLSGPGHVPFRSGRLYPCEHTEAKMIGRRVAGLLCLGRLPAKGQLGLF